MLLLLLLFCRFAHMLFWTREGLIKKVLIQQRTPDVAFWLNQKQMELLGPDAELQVRCGFGLSFIYLINVVTVIGFIEYFM